MSGTQFLIRILYIQVDMISKSLITYYTFKNNSSVVEMPDLAPTCYLYFRLAFPGSDILIANLCAQARTLTHKVNILYFAPNHRHLEDYGRIELGFPITSYILTLYPWTTVCPLYKSLSRSNIILLF